MFPGVEGFPVGNFTQKSRPSLNLCRAHSVARRKGENVKTGRRARRSSPYMFQALTLTRVEAFTSVPARTSIRLMFWPEMDVAAVNDNFSGCSAVP
jgi:hypothetical protein